MPMSLRVCLLLSVIANQGHAHVAQNMVRHLSPPSAPPHPEKCKMSRSPHAQSIRHATIHRPPAAKHSQLSLAGSGVVHCQSPQHVECGAVLHPVGRLQGSDDFGQCLRCFSINGLESLPGNVLNLYYNGFGAIGELGAFHGHVRNGLEQLIIALQRGGGGGEGERNW
jgi:hypothetical protein